MSRVNIGLDDYNPIGNHTRNASLSSAVTLTKPDGAKYLLITALTQNVVIAFDGSTATANNGHVIAAGETFFLPVTRSAVSVIESTASAEIRYTWLG